MSKQRLLTGLCWFMAIEFVIGGAAKFLPGETMFGPEYSERFVDWGYPTWFRFVVGAGEVLAAVLLTQPRRRFLGAGILVVILGGAVLTHVLNQDPLSESVSAPVHLVLAGIVAWATRPADWRTLVSSYAGLGTTR
ncbi:MAG TPA: DoxX family protein [Acidimicrobiales bacterium]|nr:DoxX family protein [Acidimicrobiales bacterium]